MFTTGAADRHILENIFSYDDPYRLLFHPMPPVGWMNDPNGLVYYNNQYHVFYQAYPYGTDNSLVKHWGHMVSDNLVDWTYLPTALAPDQPYDKGGCFSGSAIACENSLYLFYTGNVPENSPKQLQCVAKSDDGVNFVKSEKNPLFGPPGSDEDFRDPYVWQHNGLFYCLVGTRQGAKGCVRLYESKDLYNWNDRSVMFESDGSQGFMWETPNLIRIGDTDILILSVIGRSGLPHSTIYYTGTLNYETGKFVPNRCHTLDEGSEFYAPQILREENRNILIGWMDNWFNSSPSNKYGWACALSIPRELSLDNNGYLCMYPVKELNTYRQQVYCAYDFMLDSDSLNPLREVHAVAFDLEFEIDLAMSEGKQVAIGIRENELNGETTGILIDFDRMTLTVDKTCSGAGDQRIYTTAVKSRDISNVLSVRILIDRSSLEIFLQNGSTCVTYRIYPSISSDGMHIASTGKTIWFKNLTCYSMRRNEVTYKCE